jgi:AmiR/NasT family two-component response regulator
MMNGEITVESKVGEGTCFTVVLPDIKAANVDPSYDLSSELAILKTEFKKSTILLVSANETSKNIIIGFLEKYRIITIAREMISDNDSDIIDKDIDLIIFDITGISLQNITEQLSIFKNAIKAPVVALTDSMKVSKSIEKLIDSHLLLPLSKVQLITKLREYLNHIKDIDKDADQKTDKAKSVIDDKQMTIEIKSLSDELKSQFDNIILDKWEKANKTMMISNISAFAQVLLDFSENNELKGMASYSSELLNVVESFEIEKITKILPIIKNLYDTV